MQYLIYLYMCVCTIFIEILYNYCVYVLQRRGSLKGHVDLNKIKVIEKVLDGAFNKPSFQVS